MNVGAVRLVHVEPERVQWHWLQQFTLAENSHLVGQFIHQEVASSLISTGIQMQPLLVQPNLFVM
jgi:hypothetical protein